jgi:hypothetical protein
MIVPDVVFDIDAHQTALPESEATFVAEKLRVYAAGVNSSDVEELARQGTDPEWLAGARAMADAIEDVLTETRSEPIPLDRNGRAANALMQVLRLTPITSDASAGYSRLYAGLSG